MTNETSALCDEQNDFINNDRTNNKEAILRLRDMVHHMHLHRVQHGAILPFGTGCLGRLLPFRRLDRTHRR